MKEHIETYHEKINQFICTKGTLSESRSYNIYKQIKTEHDGKSEIKCTGCAFISTKLSNLNIHMKITHKEVNVFIWLWNLTMPIKEKFLSNICPIFPQYLPNISTKYAQYLPYIISEFSQYKSNICPIFGKIISKNRTIFAQYLYNICPIFCSIFVQYLWNICPLFVQFLSIFALYLHYICPIFSKYLPNACKIFV